MLSCSSLLVEHNYDCLNSENGVCRHRFIPLACGIKQELRGNEDLRRERYLTLLVGYAHSINLGSHTMLAGH